MFKANFYEILNAQPDATFEELKSNYKQLILQCHPDKLQQEDSKAAMRIKILPSSSSSVGEDKTKVDPNISQQHNDDNTNNPLSSTNEHKNSAKQFDDHKFVLINEAWNTLKDPAKRKLYDAELLLTKFQTHSNVYEHLKLTDLKPCMLELENNDSSDVDNGVERQLADNSSRMKNNTQMFYTYDCRCGGQYMLDESTFNEFLKQSHNNIRKCQTTDKDKAQDEEENDEVLIECNECSLVIKLKC